MSNQYIRVATTAEVPKGQGKSFKIGRLELAVFHTDDGFFATNDICSHEREHLGDGFLDGNTVECPKHGSQFDLKTGEALSLPATDPVEVYELTVQGDEIIVSVPEKYLTFDGIRKVL
jgi:3-phenylpropionate/trans-cinnamate dioxygenase ferredoxin subunit